MKSILRALLGTFLIFCCILCPLVLLCVLFLCWMLRDGMGPGAVSSEGLTAFSHFDAFLLDKALSGTAPIFYLAILLGLTVVGWIIAMHLPKFAQAPETK